MLESGTFLVYDGSCGFCSAAAAWIQARTEDPARVKVVAAQDLDDADLARVKLDRAEVMRAAWWIDNGEKSRGHLAVGKALAASRGPWGLVGSILLVPPVRWLAALGYSIVVRSRRLIPGFSSWAVRPADRPTSSGAPAGRPGPGNRQGSRP